jgi:hypothetical protein
MLSVDILYAQAKDCCISVRLEYWLIWVLRKLATSMPCVIASATVKKINLKVIWKKIGQTKFSISEEFKRY